MGWFQPARADMVWRDPQSRAVATLDRADGAAARPEFRLWNEEHRPMTRKQRRLSLIGASVGVLAIAVGLVLFALRGSIVFFNSPTDLVEKHVAPGTRVRLGGLVVAGSIVKEQNLNVRFEVTDGNKAIPVTYQGILPDLF